MNNLRLVMAVLCMLLISAEGETYRDRIISDLMLVVPGVGSEKAIIGSDLNEFLLRTRRANYKVTHPDKTGEIFSDILKIKTDIKIFFDYIYLNEETGSIIYSLNKVITAAGGLSADRYTENNVNFKAGVENFLFYYGNSDLVKIENSVSCVYIYKSVGIAVFDDGKNDSIDLYLVFPAAVKR
jgi:hypothetical protein